MKSIIAGIDIGATNTLIGLVDRNGICFQRENLKTRDYQTPEIFAEAVATAITKVLHDPGQDYSLSGIGIGAPNGNYHKGTIEFAANLPWRENIPLVEMMMKYFDVPVKLTNDANAAAMGEMIFGAAVNMKDFIMITLGTGLGSGIVVNGKIVYGHDGNAGELGHIIVEPGGRDCGCGRKGCLETYVSATGITRTAKIMLANDAGKKSMLHKEELNSLNSKIIYQAALQQDELALRAFDFTCDILGKSLANIVTFSSPEAIILSGGLAQASEFLIEPVKKVMEENMLKVFKDKVKIKLSQLPENDAAVLGAAALTWEDD